MGALIKWGGLMVIGALGFRGVTDGVKDVTDTAGDNVQKITPIIVVAVGAAAMAGAAYVVSKNSA